MRMLYIYNFENALIKISQSPQSHGQRPKAQKEEPQERSSQRKLTVGDTVICAYRSTIQLRSFPYFTLLTRFKAVFGTK